MKINLSFPSIFQDLTNFVAASKPLLSFGHNPALRLTAELFKSKVGLREVHLTTGQASFTSDALPSTPKMEYYG